MGTKRCFFCRLKAFRWRIASSGHKSNNMNISDSVPSGTCKALTPSSQNLVVTHAAFDGKHPKTWGFLTRKNHENRQIIDPYSWGICFIRCTAPLDAKTRDRDRGVHDRCLFGWYIPWFDRFWKHVESSVRWRSRLCQALIGIHRLWNFTWMVNPGRSLDVKNTIARWSQSEFSRTNLLGDCLGWYMLRSMWICSTFDHILSGHFVHQLSDESLPGALLKFWGRTSPEVPWECFHFKCFFFF